MGAEKQEISWLGVTSRREPGAQLLGLFETLNDVGAPNMHEQEMGCQHNRAPKEDTFPTPTSEVAKGSEDQKGPSRGQHQGPDKEEGLLPDSRGGFEHKTAQGGGGASGPRAGSLPPH